MKVLKGANLAGTSNVRERVENDFYATPTEATEAILQREKLVGNILEPACGQGHISKVLHKYYPGNQIISTDLICRGYGTGDIDFLKCDFGKPDNVITNPPFSLAQEFIEKALEIANKKVIIFAKIQLLESAKRKPMFESTPLKTVWVFSDRVTPLPNGSIYNEKGKKWESTFCFAWFVWDKEYTGKPTIDWI